MQGLVFLGGTLSETKLSASLIRTLIGKSDEKPLILAADQGAETCLKFGLIPDLVVGDFDSLNPVLPEQLEKLGSKVIRYPERKDATDGELVIEELLSSNVTEVIIFSALGPERPDHYLMNIEMLLRLKREGLSASLSDGVSLLYAIYGAEEQQFIFLNEFSYKPYVSFMSTAEALVNLRYQGLSYDLNDNLERGSSRAISNYPAFFDNLTKAEYEEKENEAWRFAFSVDGGEGLLLITPQDF